VAVLLATGVVGQEGAGEPAPAMSEELLAALIAEGEEIFAANCQPCHGPEGGGSEGPALAGNEGLQAQSPILNQVLFGGAYMPAFAQLTDREIAAVATFIRNSWENEFGGVTEETVAAARTEGAPAEGGGDAPPAAGGG
jgi:mono/diheme cytochrome c family protein